MTGLLSRYPAARSTAPVMRLTQSGFRGFAHRPAAMLAMLEDHGLRRTYQGRSSIWQIAGLERIP